ncbi:MAG: hypothetical protein GY715_03445 [Planctomycetes bacterium]|nr:hypothetical protein [Planctomycetota bacterium]
MGQEGPTTYRLFELSGRPILAVPERPRRLRLRGIDRFQPYTPRRGAYRAIMRLAMWLRADGLLGRSTRSLPTPAPDFDIARWLAGIRDRLEDPGLSAVVVWPSQPQRKRVYAHLFDEACDAVGFAKIAFDDENQRQLDGEASTLRGLETLRVGGYHTPRVLDVTEGEGVFTVIEQPLPDDARPVRRGDSSYPEAFVRAIAGPARSAAADEIRRMSWWSDCEQRLEGLSPGFARRLGSGLDSDGARVCRVHGDLGCANLAATRGGETWVLDWEASRADGPRLADPVSFNLDARFIRSTRDPRGFARRFGAEYVGGVVDADSTEIMLALAFRSAVGSKSAEICIRHWDAVCEGAS